MENTKLSQLDNNLIAEATKLSKKEQAITDPKELEALIKKWEDAVSGKTPIKNAKTGQPLSKGYCQDKLRLLKKKMISLNTNGGSAEKSSDGQSNSAQKTADFSKSLGESLLKNGWIKQSEGVYTDPDFSETYSVGIKIDIQESKGFENFAQQLIFEATGDVTLTIKIKRKKSGKEYNFTHTCNAEQLKTQTDVREIVSKYIRENCSSSKTRSEKTSKTSDFFKAWEKLSEEEHDAFIEFYGDKLAKVVTGEK